MNGNEIHLCSDRCAHAFEEKCYEFSQLFACSECSRDRKSTTIQKGPAQKEQTQNDNETRTKPKGILVQRNVVKNGISTSLERSGGSFSMECADEQNCPKKIDKSRTQTKPRKDDRPHRFSVYKKADPDWSDAQDDMLESAVVFECDERGWRPFWVNRSCMNEGNFASIHDGVFWLRVAKKVPGKDANECFRRYAAIQASAVAKFTV